MSVARVDLDIGIVVGEIAAEPSAERASGFTIVPG